MILVSIDPGLRGCGVAVWQGNTLLAATYVPGQPDTKALLADSVECMALAVSTWIGELRRYAEKAAHLDPTKPRGYAPEWAHVGVVLEYPQTYNGRAAQGDANDLVAISLVAGAVLATLGAPTRLVLPREWKGQAPKQTKHGTNPIELRSREKLTADEIFRMTLPRAKKLHHNVWDAIGIGLWHLRR